MLLRDVLRHREDLGLGRADGFVIRHPQQAQVNLLNDVGNVGGITDARAKETAKILAMPNREFLDKGVLFFRTQASHLRSKRWGYLGSG